MKIAAEILDDELNDIQIEYLKNNPIFRSWIIDAMLEFAKIHVLEALELEAEANSYGNSIRNSYPKENIK